MHASVHEPSAAQYSPGAHITPTHASGWHFPSGWHVEPAAQPAHWHVSTHAPATQTCVGSHAIDEHGSTHTPTRHTWP
jgi:hypothetical protein